MPKNEANNNGTRREDWETPKWLFDKLNKVFNFWIDLAANEKNQKCERYISEDEDFLSIDMDMFCTSSDKWAWCNPPYSRNGCGKWVSKIFEFPNSVSLLPASVGAKWFSLIWKEARAICFLDQRLRFVGAPGTAQFDSCLVVKTDWRKLSLVTNGYSEEDVLKVLRSIGNVVTSQGIALKIKQEKITYR